MHWYSSHPRRRALQLAADAAALVAVVLSIVAAVTVADAIRALAAFVATSSRRVRASPRTSITDCP